MSAVYTEVRKWCPRCGRWYAWFAEAVCHFCRGLR